MKLYFMRHAEAEEGEVDAARELTGRGRKDARRMGRFLERGGVCFDLAFSSPLVRAWQTGELVLEVCPPGSGAERKVKAGRSGPARAGSLVRVDALLNGTSDREFQRWLASLPRVESVLLVGHEPSLSARVRRMLGVTGPERLPLSKGAVARVDTEDRRGGTLKLLVGPKQLG